MNEEPVVKTKKPRARVDDPLKLEHRIDLLNAKIKRREQDIAGWESTIAQIRSRNQGGDDIQIKQLRSHVRVTEDQNESTAKRINWLSGKLAELRTEILPGIVPERSIPV